ncbi:hypothetical protein [Pedobacter sp. HDW13]|uniref:hypothetical protein n=1 Tax=Pedobacter sp. HDW13 TaxID=2714940 RepID=UPI001F1054CF|nr:hypothetical protein [Pedobacter sp. HDW13]
MLIFLKAQASSLTASATDFLITALTVSIFGWWYLAGSMIGTISGELLIFTSTGIGFLMPAQQQ